MTDSTAAGRVVDDPFDGSRRYTVVYADPPWHYRDRAHAGQRGAGFKYPDMSNQQVGELPVENMLADDALLFLWVTWPKLPETLPIITSWGFQYRTVAFVWVKRNDTGKLAWGMGSWTRANTEPCLLATRGRPKRISGGVHQVVESPLARHSEKPQEVRDRIVQLVGDVPRIELFARRPSPGWDAWGNEAHEGPGTALGDTARRAPASPELKRRLVELVEARGQVTRSEAAELLELDREEASRALKGLARTGRISRHGAGSSSWYGPAPEGSAPPPRRVVKREPAPPEAIRRHLLERVAASGRITRKEAAELLGVDPDEASRMLKLMMDHGLLERHGKGRGTWYGPGASATA